MSVLQQVNKFLLQEAPAQIRDAYRSAISDASPASRHAQLCVLGEVGLAYIGSVGVSEYRSRRGRDDKIESAFGHMRKCSLGDFLELIRLGVKAGVPVLEPFGGGQPDLPRCRRFAAGVEGVKEAVRLGARNVVPSVERRLSGKAKKLRWLGFWEQFAFYRNRAVGHSASHGWPVGQPEYYETLVPLLEEALVEALTTEAAESVFRGYTVASLLTVERRGGEHVSRVSGEHLGVPFQSELAATAGAPPAAHEPGSALLLSYTADEGPAVLGPFIDLLRDGPPEALREPPAVRARGHAAPAPPQFLFGRDSEFARIDRVLEQKSRPAEDGAPGHGHLIFLAGESGVGKSSMAQEVGRRARELGYEIADVACEPFHQGMSLFPMRELTRQLSRGSSLMEDVAAYYGGDSLQASLAQLAEDVSAAPSQRRDAVVATFANVIFGRFARARGAAARPVLIQIDDMERLDIGTADALLCVLARLREGPVVIVGAYRTDLLREAEAGGQRHPLRPVLSASQRRRDHLLHLNLSSLDRGSIRDVTQSILRGPCDLPRQFYSRLYNETEGNPLFIREILHNLSTDGPNDQETALRREDGTWRLTADVERWVIPATVEQAISARLQNLDKRQLGELEKASVIGRRFAFSVICRLSESSEDEMLDLLESFLSFDIIQEIEEGDDTFEFSHGKIRDVLYQNMSRLRRRRVHSAVADVLEGMPPSAEHEWGALIGEHLYQARRYEEACPVLLAAARSSMGTYAVREAAEQFRKAVEAGDATSFPPGEDRLDVLMEQASALKLSSDYGAALKLFDKLAADRSDPSRQGWALNHIADIDQMSGDADAALEAYTRCEDIAREMGDRELLTEVVADLHEFYDRQAERLTGLEGDLVEEYRAKAKRYLDEEVALAQESEEATVQSRAYRNVAKQHRGAGDLAEAIKNYRLGIDLSDSRVATHKVLIPYAKTLRFVAEHGEALAVVNRVLDWALQTGARRSEAIGRQYRGLLLMEMSGGDEEQLLEARREIEAALGTHAEVGFNRGERDTAVLLGEWHVRQGEWEPALRNFRRAVDADIDDRDELIRVIVAQLRAMNEEGRADLLAQASWGGDSAPPATSDPTTR